VVQVAPGVFGVCHMAKRLDVLVESGCAPAQSSLIATDPGWPLSQNTKAPHPAGWLPVWIEPQSGGIAGLPNPQPVSKVMTDSCGGRAGAAGARPGRNQTGTA